MTCAPNAPTYTLSKTHIVCLMAYHVRTQHKYKFQNLRLKGFVRHFLSRLDVCTSNSAGLQILTPLVKMLLNWVLVLIWRRSMWIYFSYISCVLPWLILDLVSVTCTWIKYDFRGDIWTIKGFIHFNLQINILTRHGHETLELEIWIFMFRFLFYKVSQQANNMWVILRVHVRTIGEWILWSAPSPSVRSCLRPFYKIPILYG